MRRRVRWEIVVLALGACIGGDATEETAAGLDPAVGPIHYGDIDQVTNRTMTVTVETHDALHTAFEGGAVTGRFVKYDWGCGPIPADTTQVLGTEAASCVTDATGRCSVRSRLRCDRKGRVAFYVDSVAYPGLTYDATANHYSEGYRAWGSIYSSCESPCNPYIVSDRDQKQQIAPVDEQAVLESVSEMPISTWSYRTDPDVRHLGPMAQDFSAAFGLGDTDRAYHSVDAHGVALASVKALYRLVLDQNARIETLEDALARAGGESDAAICEP